MDDGLAPYIGFAGLWRLELSGMPAARLGPLLEARVARNPNDASAMMDIATLSILTLRPENREHAFALQARALGLQRVYRRPASRHTLLDHQNIIGRPRSATSHPAVNASSNTE